MATISTGILIRSSDQQRPSGDDPADAGSLVQRPPDEFPARVDLVAVAKGFGVAVSGSPDEDRQRDA
jgi:hypothetical protein